MPIRTVYALMAGKRWHCDLLDDAAVCVRDTYHSDPSRFSARMHRARRVLRRLSTGGNDEPTDGYAGGFGIEDLDDHPDGEAIHRTWERIAEESQDWPDVRGWFA